jgi:hypothetical protein
VTLAAQSAMDVLDEVLLLFDQALSGREAAARERLTEVLAERARTGEDRQALLDDILAIVLDPDVADSQVGGRLRRDVGHGRMRAVHEARRERLPRDHGHLALMDASMSYLRQFVPDVLAAVGFAGGPGMDDLLQAIAILARLHATRASKVPDGAPDSFVPARWAGYLEKASKDGNVVAYRHYWELCVLMALRDGLRSGDVHVPGSRRYADPASFPCSPRSSGGRSGWSTATWWASRRLRPTRWHWRTTSCTRRCRTWRPSSPGAAGRARSASAPTGSSSSRR